MCELNLPEPYLRHLIAPQCIGDLTDAQAIGEAGSMVGGLGVRFTLSWGNGGGGAPTLSRVLGRPLGSAAAYAPVSFIAQHGVGLPYEAAAALDEQTVLAALGHTHETPLPERAEKATALAVAAFRSALGLTGAPRPSPPDGPGILVCRCIGIGDRTIRKAIHDGATTPEEVGDLCRASTGCRSCRPDLLQLLDEELRLPLPAPDASHSPWEQLALARGGGPLRALGMPLRRVQLRDETLWLEFGVTGDPPGTTPMGAAAILRQILREATGLLIRTAPAESA